MPFLMMIAEILRLCEEVDFVALPLKQGCMFKVTKKFHMKHLTCSITKYLSAFAMANSF